MIGRIVPIALFVLLAVLLGIGLKIADHKTDIPSPLIGKPVPEFALPVLNKADQVVSNTDLLGEPYLVNFWASWCPTCRYEHPIITDLAQSGALRVIGIDFRDDTADANAWLAQFGNPYSLVLVDRDGRTSIDFGVYAAPESFLVDASGKVVYKQLGAMTYEAIEKEILPRIGKEGALDR